MRTITKLIAPMLTALTLLIQPPGARAQGTLTPPGAPAPTMRTLAQIEPRTPISSLPYVITNAGSYYVTASLVGVAGSHGIAISNSAVTLDLSGFTLQGVSGSVSGVFVAPGCTGVAVRNGIVTGWGSDGVDALTGGVPRNALIENIIASTNGGSGIGAQGGSLVRDCLCYQNGGDGIAAFSSEIVECQCFLNGAFGVSANQCMLNQCRLQSNSSYGLYMTASRVKDSAIDYNGPYGVDCLGFACEVRNCRVTFNNGTGVFVGSGAQDTTIADCVIANNYAYGIYTIGIGNGTFSGNTLSQNTFGGIIMVDTGNVVKDNQVTTPINTAGIEITGVQTNVIIFRNTVIGGGSAGINYQVYGTDAGPISTAAAATSPWANISY